MGAVRRDIAAFARSRHRDDPAKRFAGPARKGPTAARHVANAIDQLRLAAVPLPLIGDGVERWLEPRVAALLRKAGIKTLVDLTLRVPRRRRWWVDIGGLGVAGARRIEAFFAAHPDLTDRARALVVTPAPESPRQRWVRPASPRSSSGWRPFAGGLSTRSRAYALSVLSAMFRWLIEQRYVLANPFAGSRTLPKGLASWSTSATPLGFAPASLFTRRWG